MQRQYDVNAQIDGHTVWTDTVPERSLGGMLAALASRSPSLNVLAENGYDLTRLAIVVTPLETIDD